MIATLYYFFEILLRKCTLLMQSLPNARMSTMLSEAVSSNINKIRTSMKRQMDSIIQNYELFRGQLKDGNTDFWDAIIITTADEDQRKAHIYQIHKKIEHKQIIQNVPFYVFADPPGVKVGGGGSVLYSLDQLYSEIGDKMFTMRILFICAGGKSQRLPSASILGKLFLPLPLGDSLFHMLDLQIALYLPFLRHMKPGVLITASDAIETYYLPVGSPTVEASWSFQNDGFTALGTISNVQIGRNHGVYVLPPQLHVGQDVVRSSCLQVLQKPSVAVMEASGAILEDGNVCTDSIFFFDHEVSKKFLNYMKSHPSITCEIDAYGDFLQPLGSRASLNYIENTDNVVSANSTLSETRKELFNMLHQTPLHVVVPQQSAFYHFGTMTEYIEHVTPNAENHLFEELNCKAVTFSRIINYDKPSEGSQCVGNPDGFPPSTAEYLVKNPLVTIMHSLIDFSVQMGQCTVIEHCHIKAPVVIGDRCIISNCKIIPRNREHKIILPSQSCFHTAAIQLDGQVKFVTIAFGISDNLKKSVGCSSWDTELSFMGIPMGDVSCVLGKKTLFDDGVESCSLWNAKLFPIADTMEESFLITNAMVNKIVESVHSLMTPLPIKTNSSASISMELILRNKSIENMIAFQEDLWKDIFQS